MLGSSDSVRQSWQFGSRDLDVSGSSRPHWVLLLTCVLVSASEPVEKSMRTGMAFPSIPLTTVSFLYPSQVSDTNGRE